MQPFQDEAAQTPRAAGLLIGVVIMAVSIDGGAVRRLRKQMYSPNAVGRRRRGQLDLRQHGVVHGDCGVCADPRDKGVDAGCGPASAGAGIAMKTIRHGRAQKLPILGVGGSPILALNALDGLDVIQMTASLFACFGCFLCAALSSDDRANGPTERGVATT